MLTIIEIMKCGDPGRQNNINYLSMFIAQITQSCHAINQMNLNHATVFITSEPSSKSGDLNMYLPFGFICYKVHVTPMLPPPYSSLNLAI